MSRGKTEDGTRGSEDVSGCVVTSKQHLTDSYRRRAGVGTRGVARARGSTARMVGLSDFGLSACREGFDFDFDFDFTSAAG